MTLLGENRSVESQEIGQRQLFCTVVVEQRIDAIGEPLNVLPRVGIHAVMVHDEASDLDVFTNCTFGNGQGKIAST